MSTIDNTGYKLVQWSSLLNRVSDTFDLFSPSNSRHRFIVVTPLPATLHFILCGKARTTYTADCDVVRVSLVFATSSYGRYNTVYIIRYS